MISPGRFQLALVLAGAAIPGARAAPDLIVDPQRLAGSARVEWRLFEPGHCALFEGCIADTGWRRLIVFDTQTANLAQEDLALGDPTTNPLYGYSECHGHYHLEEYADYSVLDPLGQPAGLGHKQGFCLLDSARYLDEPWVPRSPFYDCGNQGIQRGWSDVYGAFLDCQWVDVTGVANGSHTLRVRVNPERVIEESNYDNNTAETPVEIDDPVGITHRPDGSWIPGEPMRASRVNVSDVRIEHDVTVCPAPDYNVMWSQGPPRDYAYDGAACNVGPSGEAVLALPDPPLGGLLWFVIVGVEGPLPLPRREGGHGFDSRGRPRPASGLGLCGVFLSFQAVECS